MACQTFCTIKNLMFSLDEGRKKTGGKAEKNISKRPAKIQCEIPGKS